jgi:hypothetical protein
MVAMSKSLNIQIKIKYRFKVILRKKPSYENPYKTIPYLKASLPLVSLLKHTPATDVSSFLLLDERLQGHYWLVDNPLLD